MSLRRVAIAAVVLLVATLVSACGGSDDGEGGPGGASTPGPGASSTAPAEPLDLVGLWRVTEADGVDPETWLRLDAGWYMVWAPCGGLGGGWQAGTHAFVAAPPSNGIGDGCDLDDDLPWLSGAVAYERDGDGWRLLDDGGAVTARLHVDGGPPLRTDTIDDLLQAPEVTDRTREWLAEPAPLPDSLAPVAADDLVGRWVPVADHETEPFLDLAADRTWTGSDGCNANGGAWVVDGDGRFLTTSGDQTQIGCDGEDLNGAMASARRAGLDEETLVLLDGSGAELTRLVRG